MKRLYFKIGHHELFYHGQKYMSIISETTQWSGVESDLQICQILKKILL